LRSGEMLPSSEVLGGLLCLEGVRAGFSGRWEAARAGCAPRARPLRPGDDFLLGPTLWVREEDFERVIGMAESLYCLLLKKINFDS